MSRNSRDLHRGGCRLVPGQPDTLTSALAASTASLLTGTDAEMWSEVSPELIGAPLCDITHLDLVDSDEATSSAWRRCRKALIRATDPRGAERGPVSRGLHEVVAVIGDVTAVVAAVRVVSEPVATIVTRMLERRRQRQRDEHGVQIEVDLPAAAGPVLPSRRQP